MTFAPDDCYLWVSGGCQWTVAYLWRGWDWFARASVCLLALLALDVLVITSQRLFVYLTAKRQSRSFLRDATEALHNGRFDDVMTIAARTPHSPAASIVVEGIHAFASVPPQFTDREAIDVAERSSRRVHAVVVAELARGLGTLRSCAALSPFIGLGGTCVGVLNSFREIDMQKDAARSFIASSIAEALVMTALGLFVGILAVWFHNHLWRRVEIFGTEMWKAEATILESLKAHPDWRCRRDHTAENSRWAFLTAETPQWEVSYDHQRPLLVEVWGCGIVLAIVLFLHSC